MPHRPPQPASPRRTASPVMDLLLRPFSRASSERWLDGAYLLHCAPSQDPHRRGIDVRQMFGITPGH